MWLQGVHAYIDKPTSHSPCSRLFNQFIRSLSVCVCVFVCNCLHFTDTHTLTHLNEQLPRSQSHTARLWLIHFGSSLLLRLHKWKVIRETKIKRRALYLFTRLELLRFQVFDLALELMWLCWHNICMCTTSICQLNKVCKYLSFVDFTPHCLVHHFYHRLPAALIISCHFNRKVGNVSIELAIFFSCIFVSYFFFVFSFHFVCCCCWYIFHRTWFIFWIYKWLGFFVTALTFLWIIIVFMLHEHPETKMENTKVTVVTPPMNAHCPNGN